MSTEAIHLSDRPRPCLVVKKQPWSAYALKAGLILVALMLAGKWFSSRFIIAGDPYKIRCIQEYSIYLIDKRDTTLVRDKLYMFRSKDLSPVYPAGTQILKYLRGMPGDHVEVATNDQILVNDQVVAYGLALAQEKLGKPSASFHGKGELTQDEFWFMGTSPRSFDSRYWGAVKREDVLGRAYPIF